MKNLYFELLDKPVFSVQDINKYYDNEESARSALKRLLADGLVYKSAPSLVREFNFKGIHYQGIKADCNIGIEDVAFSGGIRVTNKERSVIDSIKDMNKISGFEEIDECISMISGLNEAKLKELLEFYSNQYLYQKAGYFFEKHKDTLKISREFLNYCLDHIGSSKRYIEKGVSGIYVSKWQIIIPNQ